MTYISTSGIEVEVKPRIRYIDQSGDVSVSPTSALTYSRDFRN